MAHMRTTVSKKGKKYSYPSKPSPSVLKLQELGVPYTFGRPTIYRPELCQQVIALAEGGLSMACICKELGISYTAFEDWKVRFADFAQAVNEARFKAQSWWEAKGHANVDIPANAWSPIAYIHQMKCRFPKDWNEQRQVQEESKGHSLAVDVARELFALARAESRKPKDQSIEVETTPVSQLPADTTSNSGVE